MSPIAAAGLSREHVFRGIQDIDHPILKGFPESLYLKAAAVKVLKLRLPR